MRITKLFLIPMFVFSLLIVPADNSQAGNSILFDTTGSDNASNETLFYFFDLRDRESFVQLSYFEAIAQGLSANMHVQIYDVGNNCNENNFFDVYTPNDTHTYNMRDIQTNDGNPSGVVLPDGAYGFVVVTAAPLFPIQFQFAIFGNMRIIDNNGYEYRTNAQFVFDNADVGPNTFYSFNFNQEAGIGWSDVVGITVFSSDFGISVEFLADPLSAFNTFDVDIYDLNEVPFSCRDVIFSCVNQESVLLEPLLEFAGTASVASFEYGINNAIPHTKGGELLCPGNTISDGVVVLRPEPQPSTENFRSFLGYVGLNNGNGRGSLDSFWGFNRTIPIPPA